MHILMIAPEQIPVPGDGSVEICMLAIAKKMAKHHTVTIVSRQAANRKKTETIGDNLTIVRVPAGSPQKYISSVIHYIKGKKYDFIQVDNRPHYMAKVKSNFPDTPVSLFLHSLTFVPKTEKVAISLKKADLIIANSVSLKQKLSEMFPGLKEKIRQIHLGVDLARFKPASEEEKSRIKKRYHLERSFTILFVGRVIPRKGVPVLMKAVRQLRKNANNVKLIIAGKGNPSYIAKLKRLAKHYTLPVLFLGKISHGRIHQVYRLADCFVCPSQKHEAFGLVNVEAMASGVPVVASNIGGIKEIITHGQNGYLVNSYSRSSSFARYFKKLADSPSIRKKLGEKGRASVEQRFSWANTAAKLGEIYQEYK